jgi:hypothetical protein
VKRLIPTPLVLLSVSLVAVVGVMTAVGAARQPAEKWSPQFPREGATKLFENDEVIVWEQIGRPTEPFAHRHIRDILTFSVEPGRVEVLGPDLQPPIAQGGSFTERIYSRGDTSLLYSRAGLGPHVEMAPDPDDLPISIFVEIKGTEPEDCAEWSTGCQ